MSLKPRSATAAIMQEFHLFPRLPLELRHQIWELANQPREVAVGRNLRRRRRSDTAIPTTMLSCMEAWTHLRPFSTRCFPIGTPPRFSLVNFNIDTVYCYFGELVDFDDDIPLVQRIIVECDDSDLFWEKYGRPLYVAKALESLTILHFGFNAVYETWWMEWDQILQEWYWRDDPINFYTRVISIDDPSAFELNSKNFLKIERDWRRNNPPPAEECPDYQVPDSDDDVDAEWRFRRGYRHVDGCNCPSRRA